MESERAYTVGSEFPPLKPGVPRLYSMRFCPYSQRVRLVLAAKKIAYETININSKKRPAWFSSELNQLGLQINHPCLQIADGHIIHESIIISEYLDSTHPQPSPLLPDSAADRATNYMLVDGFQRVAGYLFKVLKFKDAEAFNEIYKILDSYEAYLKQDFFNGKQPGRPTLFLALAQSISQPTFFKPFFSLCQFKGFVDLMIWPWFERFESLKPLAANKLEETRFPKLIEWQKRMLEVPAVKETLSDPVQMVEFYKVSLTNKEPNYDIGLPIPEPAAPEAAPAAAAETAANPESAPAPATATP